MSEMRRLAQLLVARRHAAFRSAGSQEDSVARLRAHLEAAEIGRAHV